MKRKMFAAVAATVLAAAVALAPAMMNSLMDASLNGQPVALPRRPQQARRPYDAGA